MLPYMSPVEFESEPECLNDASPEDIAEQISSLIENQMTQCLEISDGEIWTTYKTPMFGCTDPFKVLNEIQACFNEFPNAKVRLSALDVDGYFCDYDIHTAKQITFMIKNHWTPCLEVSDDGDIYLNTAMGPNYYDNRYWSLYKLPMFGCTDPNEVIREIEACKREFPNAKVRVIAFDSKRQVQTAGFIVRK